MNFAANPASWFLGTVQPVIDRSNENSNPILKGVFEPYIDENGESRTEQKGWIWSLLNGEKLTRLENLLNLRPSVHMGQMNQNGWNQPFLSTAGFFHD